MDWEKQGGSAFPLPESEVNAVQFGMSLWDYFAARAGEPPSEFVKAYIAATPMGRIRYTYGNEDRDGSARLHDAKMIAKYQVKMRVAWSIEYADAMLEARNAR